MVLLLFLIILIVVIIIEAIFKNKWNVAYFKSGFLVYRKCCKGSIISSQVNSCYTIEILVDSIFNKFKFHYVQDNLFLFKDNGFSVMHGNLSIFPASGQVLVVGRINWHIIFLIIFLIALIIDKIKANDIGVVICLLFLFLITIIINFFIQRKQFERIANIVAINLEKLEMNSKNRDFVEYHDKFFGVKWRE